MPTHYLILGALVIFACIFAHIAVQGRAAYKRQLEEEWEEMAEEYRPLHAEILQKSTNPEED